MIEAIRAELSEHCRELFGSSLARAKLDIVQLGGTGKRGGRVHFGLIGEDGEPLLFARVMRDPADALLLDREYELLKGFGDNVALRDRVPLPLTMATIDGQRVLIERAASGPLMSEELSLASVGSGTFQRHLTMATDLLVELAGETRRSVDERSFVSENLDPLRECWKDARRDMGELEAVIETLLRALDGDYTAVLVHGDFNPNNLVVDADRSCCALDWETARPGGLPLIDLFYFMSRYAYLGGLSLRPKKAARVKAFYCSGGVAARAGRLAIGQYCERSGLSRDAVQPLFQLHFLYKGRLKWQQTGLDGNKTGLWLDLFHEYARSNRGPWV
jgi:aminoglycoside phosphotransferase (APT) family kinase protein